MTSACALTQRVFKILAASFLGLFFTGLTLAFLGWPFSRMHPSGAAISAVDSDLKIFTSVLSVHHNNSGVYPSTEEKFHSLMSQEASEPRPEYWSDTFERFPVDPWGTPYRYHFSGIQNPVEPEVISAGPDGKFTTEDDLSNQD